MKKTYWWRIMMVLLGLVVFGYGWVVSFANKIGLCKIENGTEKCLVSYSPYIDSLGFLSVSLIIVSIFLFFVSDLVFKKWFKFAVAWFMVTSIFIFFAPTSSTQIIGNPTKEDISIWMGSLFVIISLIQIIILSKKQKKG